MPTGLNKAGTDGPGWQGAMILPEDSLCYGSAWLQLSVMLNTVKRTVIGRLRRNFAGSMA